MAILTQNIGKINPTDIVATLDTETGVMTISGAGETKDFSVSETPVPLFFENFQYVRKIIIEEGITNIGKNLLYMQGLYPYLSGGALQDCILESITFPDSIETFDINTVEYVAVNDYISIGGNTKPKDKTSFFLYYCFCPKLIVRKNMPSTYEEKILYVGSELTGVNLAIWNDTIIDQSGIYAYYEENGEVFFEGFTRTLSELMLDKKEKTIPDMVDGKIVTAIGSPVSIKSGLVEYEEKFILNIGSNIKTIKEEAFFGLGSDSIVKIDSPRGSITGEPWGLQNGSSSIYYKGEKIPLSIEVTKPMTDRIFYHSQPTEARDIEITVTYEDGSKAVVTNECTIIRNTNTTILFIYKHLNINYEIISYREISLIIASPPDKTEYEIGEPFDSTGLRIDVRYRVSESGQQDYYKDKPTEDYTIDGFDSSKEGKCTVRIYAMELSTSFYVNIVQLKPVGIEITLPTKLVYTKGELFDDTGLVVKAIYSSEKKQEVTDYILSGYDENIEGIQTITVSWQTFSETFTVTVISNAYEIKIMKYPNKMYYKIGEKLDTTGLIVVKVGDLGYIEEITDFSVSELDSTSVGEKEITISYSENINADTTAQFLTYFTVKVTKDGDNPFDGDATPYKVIIHWPNGEFADLTNSDLSEKVSLQESLCNENYFIFGGCNSNMLRFTTHSKQFLSTEEAATPHGNIELYLEANGIKIKMFTGTIDTGKRTSGLSKREIIAYDYLYKYRNTDISWWYKNITVDKNMMITQKQFRDLLFDYLGIEQVPTKLYYDDAMVPDNNTSGEINVVRILKDLCLQNGVFGWMNHDGKFEYVRLPENSRVKALDNSGNKIFEYFDANIHYDNYKTCSFTEGKIWYPNKVYTDPPVGVFTSGEPTAQEAYESNTFYNRNSFFVGNTEWLDAAFQGDEYGVYTVMEPIFPVCYGTFTRVTDNLYYRAQGYDLTVRGNPMNKVGDMIEIKAKKILDDGTELVWDIYSYIMSRTLNLLGDTSMEDVYSAKNAPYNGNNTQAGRKTQELSAELFQMRSEQPIISYAPFTSGSFSRAITSGEKKKDKLKCVKRISKADYDSLVSAGEARTDTLYFTWEE